jgi:hypothetical protein
MMVLFWDQCGGAFTTKGTKITKEGKLQWKGARKLSFSGSEYNCLAAIFTGDRGGRNLDSQISETFVSFVSFVVSEMKLIVPVHPLRSLKSH